MRHPETTSGDHFPLMVDKSWPAISLVRANLRIWPLSFFPAHRKDSEFPGHMRLLCIFPTLGGKSLDKAQISSCRVILPPDSVEQKLQGF